MSSITVPNRRISGTPEEAALIARAQAGDIEARNELITAHLPMIMKMVASAVGKEKVDEYLSHGVETFMDCVRLFDPARGFVLLSYVGQSIVNRVIRARRAGNLIKIPAVAHPDHAEQEGRAWHPISLDQHLRYDDDGLAMLDLIGTEQVATEDQEHRSGAVRMLAFLREKQREVLMLRARGMTLQQIGHHLGLSRERVRQIEEEAIDRLRALIAA